MRHAILSCKALIWMAILVACGGPGGAADGLDAARDGAGGALDAAVDGAEADGLPSDVASDVALDSGPDAGPGDAAAVDGFPSDAAPDSGPDWGPGDAAASPDVEPTLDSDGDGLADLEELALGTDPSHPDSDRDGVADGDEVAAGTRPTDPADAPQWQPDALSGRPHVFFGPDDVAALRARAVAGEPAWFAAVYERTRALAAAAPPSNDGAVFVGAASEQQGRIALAAAFVGLLEEDADLVGKAADLLAADFPDPTSLGLEAKYNLWESEALNGFCPAYDLVAASELVGPAHLTAARDGILRRVRLFREVLSTQPYTTWMTVESNNHSLKALAALGLCAIALNDQPTAARDLNEALTGFLRRFLDVQGTPEGGFAEGWNYLVYGSNNYLPFLAAYHRFAAGRTLPYRNVATWTAAGDATAGAIVDVVDPAIDPRVREIYLRALWAAFPNGLTPNTDDANPSALHGGLLAALFDDPRFLWNWAQSAVGWFAGAAEVPTLALLDPAMEPAAPEWALDGAFPEAGFAVFREDLSGDALWLLLQGEHGPARVNATGHEHPDATNLLLWYGGESLLLDPGYIDWDHHALVNEAQDHNLVLVDGEGPPGLNLGFIAGVDAILTAEAADDRTAAYVVSARYARTDVSRRVVRVEGGWFLLDDRLDPADGDPHTYTFQMNGNGGEDVADGTFTLLETGAEWTRPHARVGVHVLPVAGEASFGRRAEEHATGHGTWANHAMLTVAAEMPAPAGFLSVLMPIAAGGLQTTVTLQRVADGAAVARVLTGSGPAVAVLNRTGDAVAVPDAGRPGQTLTAPAGLTLALFDSDGALLHHRQFDGGTTLLDARPLP